MFRSKVIILLFFILTIIFSSSPVSAMSEEEKTFLNMYFKEEELKVISATRSLKSITQTAENVSVITKDDIELMNAHTLADVLNTVNGVVVQFFGASPGSIASASIHGSDAEQVVVFVDGIAINTLTGDVASLSDIPVQMIDRIEVIKGTASSAWGSSLGGIINVITKSPKKNDGINGILSASYGEKNTGDFRAEVSGKKDRFGYYLSAGRLQTDGMRPVEEISSNNIYAKFTYDATDKTDIVFSLFANKGEREDGDFSEFDFFLKDRFENLLATLNLTSSLTEGLDLNLSLRLARQRMDFYTTILSTGEVLDSATSDDIKYGASAKLIWKTGVHNIVIGSDYDYKKAISNIYVGEVPELNVVAVYINDTITINKFSIIPGIRYDNTDRHGDFTSPALGITYGLTDKILLRGYITKGFHLPNLGATVSDGIWFVHNPDLMPEKVWSYQLGAESNLLNYVWLKVSGFRHDIRDAIVEEDFSDGTWTVVNKDEVRRQGFEIEMKTVKFYNLTLSAAATLVRSRNLTTDEEIHIWPDYTYDVSLKYDNGKSFRAILKGRYAWWHQGNEMNAKYDSFIFDLNLIKTVLKKQDSTCEVFLTGHNIFDGSQYSDYVYKNAGRWIEAGVRYKF